MPLVADQPASTMLTPGRWSRGMVGDLTLAVTVMLAVVAELLGFTLFFEVHRLIAAAGFGELPLKASMVTPRLIAGGLVAGVAATLLFGGKKLLRLLAEARAGSSRGLAWAFFAGQVMAFGVFLAISGMLLSIADAGARTHPASATAWVLAGLGSAALAVAAVLPPARWWPIARAIPGAIAVGLVVGLATPAAGLATTSLWRWMGDSTLQVVVAMLGLVHPAVVRDPIAMSVGTPEFVVRITPECSGYEGIGLVMAFLSGYLWYERRRLRFPAALMLLPIGAVAIWVFNAMRIAALVTIGAWGAPRLAAEGFHSQAGSIAFIVVALGLAALSHVRAFRPVEDSEPIEQPASKVNPVAPYLMPQLAIVGASMLGASLSIGDGFDRGYPIRVVAALAAFAWFASSYRGAGLGLDRSWSSALIGPGSGVLVFALWMALEPAAGTETGPPSALRSLPTLWAAAWVACRVVGSVVLVPIAEELAFRGFLARRLMAADFESIPGRSLSWLAMLVSSVIFGALHGRWVAGTVAGMIFALTYRQRGRLGDAIVSHATANGLIAALVLVKGMWSLWS